MINFDLINIPDIIFGKDTERRCGELLKSFGAKKVLIHHSGEPFVLPLIEKVKGYLQEAGLDYVELGGVVPNPVLSKVYEGIELCRRERVDSVLAVGGGSVIDSAKGIACGTPYDGDVWDMYRMVAPVKERLIVGVISTFAGTGSECSCASVVTNEKLRLKLSIATSPSSARTSAFWTRSSPTASRPSRPPPAPRTSCPTWWRTTARPPLTCT